MPAIPKKLTVVKLSFPNFCLVVFFILFFTISSFAQQEINSKINKSETEVGLFVIGDHNPAFGIEMVYRLPVIKKMKMGAGVLYGTNIEGTYGSRHIRGYGVVLADVLQFLGKREKWGVGGQFGKGLYNRDIGFDKIKGRIYYSLSGNYRAIVSKKMLLNISLLVGHRNFHYKNTGYTTDMYYIAFTGLKFGIVF